MDIHRFIDRHKALSNTNSTSNSVLFRLLSLDYIIDDASWREVRADQRSRTPAD